MQFRPLHDRVVVKRIEQVRAPETWSFKRTRESTWQREGQVWQSFCRPSSLEGREGREQRGN
jgi:hypothetical protein